MSGSSKGGTSVLPSRSANAQVDLAAVGPHSGKLGQRRLGRHEEVGARIEAGGRQGHGLSVVAGARRHHPPIELVARETTHLVKDAADLERSRELQALRLHHHGRAEPARQLTRREHRRLANVAGDQLGGPLDVSGSDRLLRCTRP
jgi:hypothetical protein